MAGKNNETKQKILNVSLSLIKERGYDNVTLNDICAANGISKNTFYYYFKSKEEILFQSYKTICEFTLSRISLIFSAENYVEQLWMLDEPLIDFIISSGCDITKRLFVSNFAHEAESYRPTQLQTDMVNAAIAILKKAQNSRQIANMTDAHILIKSKTRLLFGTIIEWCFANAAFNLKSELLKGIEALYNISPDYSQNIKKLC